MKDPETRPAERKKTYEPPVLVQYGSIVDLTKGKNSSGADLLAGVKR